MSQYNRAVKDLEKIVTSKAFKKTEDKDEKAFMLSDALNIVIEEFILEGHHKSNSDANFKLFGLISDVKIAKTIRRLAKLSSKKAKKKDSRAAQALESFTLDKAIVLLIETAIRSANSLFKEDALIVYGEVADIMIGKDVRKIAEDSGVYPDTVMELMVFLPHRGIVTEPYRVQHYLYRITSRIYDLVGKIKLPEKVDVAEGEDIQVVQEDTLDAAKQNLYGLGQVDNVRVLFKKLFGKENLNNVAIGICLEHRSRMENMNQNQLMVWNVMTNFALNQLESMDKKELKEFFGENYVRVRVQARKKGVDASRHVNFDTVSESVYQKLTRIFQKYKELNKTQDGKTWL